MLRDDLNWLVIIGLIAFALLLVYVILPRVVKNYSSEKGIKLALVLGMMGFLSYDFYMKEKYAYIAFFAVGAAVYTYLIVIAKKKG
ncbi:MAG: hypothetical protein SGJ00_12495 [bacterium]|nr:hypothetical protein [bacterium]